MREKERERERVGEKTSVSDQNMRVQPHLFRSMKNDREWCASGWVGTVIAGYYIHTMARPPHGSTKVKKREREREWVRGRLSPIRICGYNPIYSDR